MVWGGRECRVEGKSEWNFVLKEEIKGRETDDHWGGKGDHWSKWAEMWRPQRLSGAKEEERKKERENERRKKREKGKREEGKKKGGREH